MVEIIPPYVALLMVGIALSIWFRSSLPMQLSSCLEWHCPYGWDHPSLWFSPHGLNDIVHMLSTIPPYASLLMVAMILSSQFNTVVLMLLSPRFLTMCPHANYHISGARYKLEDTFFNIMRTHDIFMSCPHGCWHMLLLPPPYGNKHSSTCTCPYA